MHLYKANAQGMRCQIKPKLVWSVFSLMICMSVSFLRSLSSCVQQGSLLPIKPFSRSHLPKIQSPLDWQQLLFHCLKWGRLLPSHKIQFRFAIRLFFSLAFTAKAWAWPLCLVSPPPRSIWPHSSKFVRWTEHHERVVKTGSQREISNSD